MVTQRSGPQGKPGESGCGTSRRTTPPRQPPTLHRGLMAGAGRRRAPFVAAILVSGTHEARPRRGRGGAAYQALATIGNGTYPGSYAQTLGSCPETGIVDLSNGCLYAQQNGFTHNGHNSHQDVTMESESTELPTTVLSRHPRLRASPQTTG